MTAIIIPIWCQNQQTLDMLYSAAASWKQQSPIVVYPTCNRLHGITPDDLQVRLAEISGQSVRVLYEPYIERTVAGAWNHGIRSAECDGHEDFVITAQDVFWHPYAIDRLVTVGRPREDSLTSGVEERQATGEDITEGADFSGMYLSNITRARFGEFYEGYKPGYFEDNDYVAQVWKLNGNIGQTHTSRFFHSGSGTIKLDAELAQHVSHWFGINNKHFVDRWGSDPVGTKVEAKLRYRL